LTAPPPRAEDDGNQQGQERSMAKIRHIAIFSDNPTKLAQFYGTVYGIRVTGTDDIGCVWATDGYMDIALLRRRNADAPKAGIHHWGFTIDKAERPAVLARMKQYGVEPFSPYVTSPDAHRPYAEDAVKDPDGNRFDLSTGMRDMRVSVDTAGKPLSSDMVADDARALIKHIAIFSENPTKLSKFYVDVFGLKITGESQGDVWVTDGYVDMALLSRKNAKSPPVGIHHWGFTVSREAKPEIYATLRAMGLPPSDPRVEDPTIDRPYVEDKGHDIDGNRFDLTTSKRDMDVEKARTRERLSAMAPAK
jgi:predicted enzyme related to lactoylglutathione lyase